MSSFSVCAALVTLRWKQKWHLEPHYIREREREESHQRVNVLEVDHYPCREKHSEIYAKSVKFGTHVKPEGGKSCGQPFMGGEQKTADSTLCCQVECTGSTHRDGRDADANCYIGRGSFFRPTHTPRRNGIVNREVNAPSSFPEHWFSVQCTLQNVFVK